jgi:hypothetical protein
MDEFIYFDKLHASKMFIDNGYQRPVSKEKINDMLKSFDEKALTALIVSKRENGTYAVIDGQHRYQAGKIAGVEYFNCLVYDGLEYKVEADMFHKINVKRGIVKSTLQFKSALEAQHEMAIHIKEIVENNGYHIEFVKSTKPTNMIACVAELIKAYQISPLHLDLVLQVLRAAYDGNKKSLAVYFIEGTSLFIKNHIKEINLKRFVTLLKNTPIDTLLEKAKKRKDFEGGRLGYCLEIQMLELYNKKLRTKIERKKTEQQNDDFFTHDEQNN